jgi:hypothetical protein
LMDGAELLQVPSERCEEGEEEDWDQLQAEDSDAEGDDCGFTSEDRGAGWNGSIKATCWAWLSHFILGRGWGGATRGASQEPPVAVKQSQSRIPGSLTDRGPNGMPIRQRSSWEAVAKHGAPKGC